MPQGKHESLAAVENIVGIVKYSLKANKSWSTLLGGKLNIFQTDYLIQSVINSLNSRPLCIIDQKIISPCYIQNLLFHKAYQEDVLAELTHLTPHEKTEKFKHLLNKVHILVDKLHMAFAYQTIPKLLDCKGISYYKNKLGGSIHSLEVGCLVFDPRTYLKTYNMRHAIFRIAWLSSDKR